ncbi:hypothetical protein Pmani_029690 [Petrolisthes manimaculis]|uniref:Uncharacterized protein n=1 Tax=Petrolisthes manimaculis TaxID=1843537 RepID=A0AAE1TTM0_9EUCA|nr:hypothetical protein Pmani_029690 [Petrolisthes manimaculis]
MHNLTLTSFHPSTTTLLPPLHRHTLTSFNPSTTSLSLSASPLPLTLPLPLTFFDPSTTSHYYNPFTTSHLLQPLLYLSPLLNPFHNSASSLISLTTHDTFLHHP